jgi:adenylate cyclase
MNSRDREQRAERRLAAILAADVAGYSRLMGADEEGTLAALKAIRRDLSDPRIAEHRGRIVKTTGDGLLVEFASVVDAVRCAVEMQQGMAGRNADVPAERRIAFRIGINLGGIISDDNDIYGDGVNVAARLETLAEPGRIYVSRVVHDQVQDKLDLAFDDLGEQQVKNIARPVHVYRVGPKSLLSTPPPHAGERRVGTAEPPPLALPDKPSLAVLPFQNMSGDPEQEYFADGMVEEITTAISRLPWLFVIARNSAFTYKGKPVDVKQVARDLGVRYVLEGSVRKAGNRVRITGQLIDTASGAHIWADRFDGTLDDIFELQDQVASSVAGAIEPKLRQWEIDRAARKPTDSLDVYDLYLRALAELQAPGVETCDAALALLRQALALAPAFAPAIALIAHVRMRQWAFGVALAPDEFEEGIRMARRGIELGRDDPDVLSWSAMALAWLGGDHPVALNAIDLATKLNPNSARGWLACGMANCFAGRPEPAIAAIPTAMRLSPLDPATGAFKSILGYALMIAGRYDEAMEWTDRALQDRPNNHFTNRLKVALSGYLDSPDAAERVARLRTLNPAMTIAEYRNMGKALSDRTMAVWLEGFCRAGLPEE